MKETKSLRRRLLDEIGGPPYSALERLIYVVGSARGGTTLTQELLSRHDDVIAMYGPSHFLNHVWRYRKRIHDRLWLQLLWTPENLRRSAVRDSLPEKKRRAFVRLINITTAEKKLHDLYQLYPLVTALDPDDGRDAKRLVAWLDKGNDFRGVDLLPGAFPMGRFVFVVRDPRGAVTSLSVRHANLRADTEFKAETADIIRTAIYWTNLAQRQLGFARRHPDKTVVFHFEDLTAQPVEAAAALFASLDLPVKSDATIEKYLSSLTYTTSNTRGEKGSGINTAPNARWKSSLDETSRQLIEEICGATARLLGYDVPQTAKRRGMVGIAMMVPGIPNKIVTLGKLLFLSIHRAFCVRGIEPLAIGSGSKGR